MRRLRVLVLAHPDLVPPEVISALSPREAFGIRRTKESSSVAPARRSKR